MSWLNSGAQAVALGLKASDPSRYLRYRRAAWRQLRKEVRSAPASELWRYTADMLYKLQNPIVREAFFPSGAPTFGVEPAQPDDAGSVFDIVRRWDGLEAMRCLELWWKDAPHSFYVVREPEGKLAGFSCVFHPELVTPELEDADPIVRNWMEHLRVSPVPAMQCALFFRRWLSRESGEGPCGVQGALWLDIKRTYMLLRPRLRRVYSTSRDAAFQIYAPALGELGFQAIPNGDTSLDGEPYRTAMLDFGPSSVDGWLGGLVAKELGSNGAELLDIEARELIIEGQRVPLTPLEFSVMNYLHEQEDSAVSRESLLRDVWGHKYDVGSNVIDVVVRSIRKKLGHHASMIETVSGFGYRFRQTARNHSP
jgi:DNA-binding winged helix-turn-helix (wHTH) protein